MLPILRELPYSDEMTEISAPGVREFARPYQIIVWVSVTPADQLESPASARRFPAILDTGLNDNFIITPVHLRAWAGLHWNSLPEEGPERFHGATPVPIRRANVWLHPNQPGWRDWLDPLRPAVLIDLFDGITVYGNGEQVGTDPRTRTLSGPRLPLLGLRALTDMGCQFHIDCARRLVSLELP